MKTAKIVSYVQNVFEQIQALRILFVRSLGNQLSTLCQIALVGIKFSHYMYTSFGRSV
jgi:hypothetical protein